MFQFFINQIIVTITQRYTPKWSWTFVVSALDDGFNIEDTSVCWLKGRREKKAVDCTNYFYLLSQLPMENPRDCMRFSVISLRPRSAHTTTIVESDKRATYIVRTIFNYKRASMTFRQSLLVDDIVVENPSSSVFTFPLPHSRLVECQLNCNFLHLIIDA